VERERDECAEAFAASGGEFQEQGAALVEGACDGAGGFELLGPGLEPLEDAADSPSRGQCLDGPALG
jgi:hypothetical protein